MVQSGTVAVAVVRGARARSAPWSIFLAVAACRSDELRGMKKGFMELADTQVTSNADGKNKIVVEAGRAKGEHALHCLQRSTQNASRMPASFRA